jgi:3-deoxy-D-manno-octulosonic acid kinase
MSNTLFVCEHNGYTISSLSSLTPDTLEHACTLMELERPAHQGVLEGRRSAVFANLRSVGPVVVKHYARGGLLGKFVDSYFVRTGPIRAEIEFNTLLHVRKIGVQAPEPILFAYRGKWIYQTWLVTRELEAYKNLMELARTPSDALIPVLAEVVAALEKLILNRITHIDLHPGNILVAPTGQVAVIDFDKAHYWEGSLHQLRDFYLRRWRRAVIKHKLPELLAEFVSAGLRKRFEQESLR